MIKNYIWDFDGMLFDSYPHCATAFVKMMADHDISVDYNEVIRLMRNSYNDAYQRYDVNDAQKKLLKTYERDQNITPIVTPYPDTYQVLETIYKRGGRNFLYTHRDLSAVEYIKTYDMDGFFTEFVTSDNNFKSKPEPDAILYLVEKYKMDKSETIMIGDREIDVLAGKNAGIRSCLFDEFRKNLPTAADTTVTEIIRVLDI
ncbi:MAG: HAD-IA family hydrolase [Clostridiaceae bacterium]|jgi:HAD superfamily hydrolase (TIGR01549 family)|nr:HAD-IA family hydrolase [Clostridiaceae bacterium]